MSIFISNSCGPPAFIESGTSVTIETNSLISEDIKNETSSKSRLKVISTAYDSVVPENKVSSIVSGVQVMTGSLPGEPLPGGLSAATAVDKSGEPCKTVSEDTSNPIPI